MKKLLIAGSLFLISGTAFAMEILIKPSSREQGSLSYDLNDPALTPDILYRTTLRPPYDAVVKENPETELVRILLTIMLLSFRYNRMLDDEKYIEDARNLAAKIEHWLSYIDKRIDETQHIDISSFYKEIPFSKQAFTELRPLLRADGSEVPGEAMDLWHCRKIILEQILANTKQLSLDDLFRKWSDNFSESAQGKCITQVRNAINEQNTAFMHDDSLLWSISSWLGAETETIAEKRHISTYQTKDKASTQEEKVIQSSYNLNDPTFIPKLRYSSTLRSANEVAIKENPETELVRILLSIMLISFRRGLMGPEEGYIEDVRNLSTEIGPWLRDIDTKIDKTLSIDISSFHKKLLFPEPATSELGPLLRVVGESSRVPGDRLQKSHDRHYILDEVMLNKTTISLDDLFIMWSYNFHESAQGEYVKQVEKAINKHNQESSQSRRYFFIF